MATLFDPYLGLLIDGHVLQTLLARGGMGAAYLATHQALSHSRCVIKLVLAEIARHPQGIMRIQLEAEALSRLNKHENIVKLQNFGVLPDGQFYLRFEFIEGVTLQRYVIDQGGLLPLRKAANLIFQVCNAMEFAHSLGIIHRDLKPDNIMIEFNPPGSTHKERVKVLDFGIAKVAAGAVDPTGSGVIVGTARYMAPEQATNAAAVTCKADVFSLAQILYLLLTGKLPWGTPESDVAIYYKQRTEAPAWPPEELVPPAVARVIMRCLSLNPDDRPTMRELAIELAAAFEGGTELLEKVVPDWVASSPPDATTLPRSAVADPTVAPGQHRAANVGVVEDREHVSSPRIAAPNVSPVAPAPGARALQVTANARPRALAAARATSDSSPDALSPPVRSAQILPVVTDDNATASPGWTPPPTPVIAALPTGLVSQRFDAPEPPPETREPSIVVAAEINLAAGTPGPQPYAHTELPAVLVSNTQLSRVTPPPSAREVSSPGPPEPPPLVVLPASARVRPASRRVLIAVLAGGLVLLAIATFAIVQRTSRGTGRDDRRGSTSAAAERSSDAGTTAPSIDIAAPPPGQPADRGSAASNDRLAIATSPGHAIDADPISATVHALPVDAGADAGTAAVAGPPMPTSHDQVPAARPEARTAVSRPSTPPRSLRARQLEARETGAKTGNLHLLVTPWAVCWVDGERIDQTPCMLDGVPTGRYRVRLENKVAHKDETLSVTVAPGETTTIERTW